MTAEEGFLAREQRLSGSPMDEANDDMSVATQIVEGMTAEGAEATKTTRLQ